MAKVLQVAQQEGPLDACLAWITYHDIQHGRRVPQTTILAEHWRSLDGLDLAWETQEITCPSNCWQDLFVQVHFIKDYMTSLPRIARCQAGRACSHVHPMLSVMLCMLILHVWRVQC